MAEQGGFQPGGEGDAGEELGATGVFQIGAKPGAAAGPASTPGQASGSAAIPVPGPASSPAWPVQAAPPIPAAPTPSQVQARAGASGAGNTPAPPIVHTVVFPAQRVEAGDDAERLRQILRNTPAPTQLNPAGQAGYPALTGRPSEVAPAVAAQAPRPEVRREAERAVPAPAASPAGGSVGGFTQLLRTLEHLPPASGAVNANVAASGGTPASPVAGSGQGPQAAPQAAMRADAGARPEARAEARPESKPEPRPGSFTSLLQAQGGGYAGPGAQPAAPFPAVPGATETPQRVSGQGATASGAASGREDSGRADVGGSGHNSGAGGRYVPSMPPAASAGPSAAAAAGKAVKPGDAQPKPGSFTQLMQVYGAGPGAGQGSGQGTGQGSGQGSGQGANPGGGAGGGSGLAGGEPGFPGAAAGAARGASFDDIASGRGNAEWSASQPLGQNPGGGRGGPETPPLPVAPAGGYRVGQVSQPPVNLPSSGRVGQSSPGVVPADAPRPVDQGMTQILRRLEDTPATGSPAIAPQFVAPKPSAAPQGQGLFTDIFSQIGSEPHAAAAAPLASQTPGNPAHFGAGPVLPSSQLFTPPLSAEAGSVTETFRVGPAAQNLPPAAGGGPGEVTTILQGSKLREALLRAGPQAGAPAAGPGNPSAGGGGLPWPPAAPPMAVPPVPQAQAWTPPMPVPGAHLPGVPVPGMAPHLPSYAPPAPPAAQLPAAPAAPKGLGVLPLVLMGVIFVLVVVIVVLIFTLKR